MKFARIEMLFLIWAVPLLLAVVIYGVRRRKTILSNFARPRSLSVIVKGDGSSRRWLKIWLFMGTLILTAAALAGPQYGYKWQKIQRKGIDIIVAVDCSRSMLAADIKPTRLDRAKREVYDLLNMLRGDRIGLAAFSGTAFLQCPLTLDYQAFHIFLNSLSPDYLPVGGTNLYAAISTALDGFDPKSTSEKAVILITDGEHTGEGDPLEAAKAAAEQKVKLFCIGIGSEAGVPVPGEKGGLKKDKDGKIIVTRLDETLLKKISLMTGGTYVRSVAGDMDLDVIYSRDIRGKMKQGELAEGRRQVWENRYQWLAGLAVLLLLFEMATPAVKKNMAGMLFFFILLASPGTVQAETPYREGVTAYENGQYEEALNRFIDAQLDDPDNPKILYNIGNTYYRLKQYDEAEHYLKMASEAKDRQLKAKSLYNLGNTRFRKGEYDEAIKNYTASMKLNPGDINAKENIEFVKQVKTQQPPPRQDQKQDQDKKKKDDKKKEGQDQKKGQSGDKDQKNKQEQKKGDKKQDQQSAKSDDSSQKKKDQSSEQKKEGDKQNKQPQPKPSEKKEDQQQAQGAPAKPAEPTDEEKAQAEKILNRLKDQPGAAMMQPGYGNQHVEKDW